MDFEETEILQNKLWEDYVTEKRLELPPKDLFWGNYLSFVVVDLEHLDHRAHPLEEHKDDWVFMIPIVGAITSALSMAVIAGVGFSSGTYLFDKFVNKVGDIFSREPISERDGRKDDALSISRIPPWRGEITLKSADEKKVMSDLLDSMDDYEAVQAAWLLGHAHENKKLDSQFLNTAFLSLVPKDFQFSDPDINKRWKEYKNVVKEFQGRWYD